MRHETSIPSQEQYVKLPFFKEKIKDFLVFLEVEKNVSAHTVRAYQSDLQQMVLFWDMIVVQNKRELDSFDKVIRRFAVSLFYKKINKATLARKLSCLRSFQQFLHGLGMPCAFNFKAPRLDKKLPMALSVDEVFFLMQQS